MILDKIEGRVRMHLADLLSLLRIHNELQKFETKYQLLLFLGYIASYYFYPLYYNYDS